MKKLPANARLVELIKELALKTGEFTLSSGAKSSYFIDMGQVTNHSEGLDIITSAILRRMGRVDSIGGPALGAAPLIGGTLISHQRDHYGMARSLRGFLVRKEPKDGQIIEGNFRPGDKVVVVEDVVTSGGQTAKAIRHIEEAGGVVECVIAVVDRLAGASELLAPWNFYSLLTIEDLGISGKIPEPSQVPGV